MTYAGDSLSKGTRISKYLILLMPASVILLIIPFFRILYVMHVIVLCAIMALFSVSWDIIGGLTKQYVFGHTLFFGIGSYVTAFFAHRFFKLHPFLTMPIGVVVAVGLAFLIGYPCLRLKGHYLALMSLAFSEFFRLVFIGLFNITGGAEGVYGIPALGDLIFTYYFVIFALFIIVFGVYRSSSSFFGLILRAIGDNEDTCESIGINTARFKIYSFMISGGIASFAGSLFSCYLSHIEPDMVFSLHKTLEAIAYCILGGSGTIVGPVIGAFVLLPVSEIMRAIAESYRVLTFASALLFMSIVFPRGIIGTIKKRMH